MNEDKDYENWVKQTGLKFLKDIGIKEGNYVLDFGCKHGTYVVPTAKIVGEKGKVVGIDKNKDSLKKCKDNIVKHDLKNIHLIHSTDEINIPYTKNFFDCIIFFDVVHLINDKEKLFSQFHYVLKDDGFLSFYSRHHKEDMDLNLDGIIKLVEDNNFKLIDKSKKNLMHDDKIVKDDVLLFMKK